MRKQDKIRRWALKGLTFDEIVAKGYTTHQVKTVFKQLEKAVQDDEAEVELDVAYTEAVKAELDGAPQQAKPSTKESADEVIELWNEGMSYNDIVAIGYTDAFTYGVLRDYIVSGGRPRYRMQAAPSVRNPPNMEMYAAHDAVNHPPHYTTGKIEVIDFIEDQKLGYHLGNVIKYVARAKHKGDYVENLKKAQWYLNREVESHAQGI